MNFLSLPVYLVLQILFLPLAVIGALMVAYRQLWVSKRLGVSQTAIEILNGRWTMHIFDLRKDEAAYKLAGSLPNDSPLGLWLALFPLWVKFKISGKQFGYPRIPQEERETLADLVTARSVYFDRILKRNLEGASQFVVLGAGFDTRAYGEHRASGVRFFEVDQAVTQRLKLSGLNDAGIPFDHVTFVEVDFSTEDPFEKLISQGFDPEEKTVFLMEGVTLYLSEEDVRRTLRGIAAHSGAGSVLVADFYGLRMIRLGRGKATFKALEMTGEGLNFGLNFVRDLEGRGFESELRDFLESEDMTVGETDFMGVQDRKGPFMVVAEVFP